MTSVARNRLTQERKNWRKDHPFGFVARPETLPDGSINWMTWKCSIPGKKGTDWEGGLYPVDIIFNESYPSKAPYCKLPANFIHPNIYPSGKVCLSIINDDAGWKPSISIKQILTGIQDLLDNPNLDDPAQVDGFELFTRKQVEYRRVVRSQAQKYSNTL